MKLLVFAHTPPPHHGQSYMVQLMLDGFGGDRRSRNRGQPRDRDNPFGLECYQVNARISKDLEDIGSMRPQKSLILLWHCVSAIWCRFRYSVRVLYYIPAPGKRSAIWRDWLVMALCRPFFDHLVLHWHAAGMSRWLQTAVQMRTRKATYRTLGLADLSIVLSECNRRDAEKLLPHKVCVVHNGIPDPCPRFEEEVLPQRRERFASRSRALSRQEAATQTHLEIRVLYLAHCTREKGLFDTMEGVRIANDQLRRTGTPARFRLKVAGSFVDERERVEFNQQLTKLDADEQPDYVGFAAAEARNCLYAETDIFCFPTYFYAESFGLVVVEALAFGLPVVATNWRSIPEVLPAGYPGLVEPRNPGQIAEKLLIMARHQGFEEARRHFMNHYLLERHLDNLAKAIRGVNARAA